ncbi:MAG TPA: hypothetical protein VGL53_12200 [Bryobacteraceae bacterium]
MTNEPEWVAFSEKLERENRLAEAEALINASDRHNPLMSLAELYRKRYLRLGFSGDVAGANEARSKASNWASYYASTSSSGGEGTARSREVDEFHRTLYFSQEP